MKVKAVGLGVASRVARGARARLHSTLTERSRAERAHRKRLVGSWMRKQHIAFVILFALACSTAHATVSNMRTRSQQYESIDTSASGGIFGQHAFEHFSGLPTAHAAAPTLLECIAAVGSDDVLDINALPTAPSLSDETHEWLATTLVECGFEKRPDGRLQAAPELVDSLRKEQNAARQRAHAAAAASREALLTSTLASLAQASASGSPTLGSARAALKQFLASFEGQPAVGPLFLGVAGLLKAQANAGTAGVCWHVDRATILNGGDEFVRLGVPLLAELGLLPCAAGVDGGSASVASLEEGTAPSELSLQVAEGIWADHEMHALASVLERKGGRYGARAGGRIEPTARSGAFTPRVIASWPAWVASVLGAWLYRLTP